MIAGTSIEERLRVLEDALAAQQRVTLNTVQAGVYLGQAVSVTALVTSRISSEPLVGVPVTLVTPWGVLRGGDDLEEGGSLTVLTGADGRVRVVLRPKLSVISDEQQDAMESMLAQMRPDASTPAEAAASLQELARQYRWEANGPFRAAVDAYAREFAQKALQRTGWRDSLPAWPMIPAAVIAYAGGAEDGGAGAAAVLTVQFRNWLGPWLLTYQDLLDSQSTLKAEILKVKQRTPSPAGLLAGVFNRASLAVDSEFGELGGRLAKKSAEAVIGDFLDNGVSELPAATRTAIGPALRVGASAFAAAGASVVTSLCQTQVSTAGVTVSLAGKADSAALDTLRTATTEALSGKVETTAFEGVRKQLSDTLGAKLDRAELGPALSVKADTAAVTSLSAQVDAKTDLRAFEALQRSTNQALASKVDAAALEGVRKQLSDTLGAKLDRAELGPALSVKADAAAVTSLSAQVDAKADLRAFEALQRSTNQALASKVDAASFEGFRKQVDEKLNLKVTQAALDAVVASVQTGLAAKVDVATLTTFQTSVNTVLAAKMDRTAFDQFNTTVQGRLKNIEVKIPR